MKPRNRPVTTWPIIVVFLGVSFFLVNGISSEDSEWYSSVYEINLSYSYSSQCNPGYCEGEKTLELVANIRNIAFGHAPTPTFSCWIYQKMDGNMFPQFGHGDGDAQIAEVEMCPHLSGSGEEPNKITNRNNDFDVNLQIIPKGAEEDLVREMYGYDDDTEIPEPILEQVWFQFQAMTPFSNPAYEWENSDGNGLVHTWSVVFGVPVQQLKKSQEIPVQVPLTDDCGKGEWAIRFRPISG